jgi:hypothetical protein
LNWKCRSRYTPAATRRWCCKGGGLRWRGIQLQNVHEERIESGLRVDDVLQRAAGRRVRRLDFHYFGGTPLQERLRSAWFH